MSMDAWIEEQSPEPTEEQYKMLFERHMRNKSPKEIEQSRLRRMENYVPYAHSRLFTDRHPITLEKLDEE